MISERPLNFLWRRATLDFVLEGYFIREILLGALDRPLRVIPLEDDQPVPFGHDMLIASLNTEAAPLLKEARARGFRNIGLFHMGDEEGTQERAFYAHADYVIRNYWCEPAFKPPHDRSLGVIWVPNGYRHGVGPLNPRRHLTIAQRQIIGFFAGAMTGRLLANQREAMLNAVSAAKLPFAIITTEGFGKGLGPLSYISLLGNTRFALVPAGNSHETIRLYDALEAGAIPIMIRSAFVGETAALGALGEPPFILLESWDQLAAAYGPYADASADAVTAALEEKRQAVIRWWAAFKITQQMKVKELVERSFAEN